VVKRDEVTEVTVTADGIIGDYDTFTLDSPPRLVLDLWGLKRVLLKDTVPADASHVKRIRTGIHPKKIRLVLDVAGTKVPPYRIDKLQNELVIALSAGGSME